MNCKTHEKSKTNAWKNLLSVTSPFQAIEKQLDSNCYHYFRPRHSSCQNLKQIDRSSYFCLPLIVSLRVQYQILLDCNWKQKCTSAFRVWFWSLTGNLNLVEPFAMILRENSPIFVKCSRTWFKSTIK